MKRIEWDEIKLIDLPSDADLNFQNIDNLWYRHLDYAAYLWQQLVTLTNQKRTEYL